MFFLPTQDPDDVAGGAVDVGQRPGIAGRDEIVAGGVLVDAVHVEEVVRRVAFAVVADRSVAVPELVMLRRPPFEDGFAGLEVDLLYQAVPQRAFLALPGRCQVSLDDLVYDQQRGAGLGDPEVVQVSVEPVGCSDLFVYLVMVIQLMCCQHSTC